MTTKPRAININIDAKKIRALETVTVDVTVGGAPRGDGRRCTATGPLLENLLNEYGKSQKDFEGIRLTAEDGYSIEIPRRVLQRCNLIIAHTINGYPLGEGADRFRIIAPGEKPVYWIDNPVEMELLRKTPYPKTGTLFIFEGLISQTEIMDYTYRGSTDKAVKMKDLLRLLYEKPLSDTASFLAVDGFKKNEKLDILSKGFIKFTGKDAPIFLAPDLPQGMHIKDIYLCTIGDIALTFLSSAIKLWGNGTAAYKKGIALKTLIRDAGFWGTGKYRLIMDREYNRVFNRKDLEGGIIVKNNKGQADVLMGDATEESSRIEDVISIVKCTE